MQHASAPPPYNVFIADDSAVARAYIAKIVAQDPLFKVRGSAANGEIALKSLLLSMNDAPIDILILDLEMPVMGGLEALPKLLEISPTMQIIIAAAVGAQLAEISLEAFNQGAKDFILKPSSGTGFANAAKFQQELLEKMRHLVHGQATQHTPPAPNSARDLTNFVARSSTPRVRRPSPIIIHNAPVATVEVIKEPSSSPSPTPVAPPAPSIHDQTQPKSAGVFMRTHPAPQSSLPTTAARMPLAPLAPPVPSVPPQQSAPSIILQPNQPATFKNRPAVFAIGCSTGGPQALITLLKELKPLPHIPTFLTQHMPPTFTKIFAEQISQQTPWQCVEASDGMVVENGKLYLAAGDYHLIITKTGTRVCTSLLQDPPENFCRPAVDPMLRSLISVYGARNIVTLILTGMGQDGFLGCQQVVQGGGVVIAQDEKSSVVWGMPGAVAKAGLCQAVLPLKDIASYINQAMGK
jgi:two-component system chemotaxis response regulator CheB